MRFFKTLFDASFREARRAEGRGEYRRAAELYLAADEGHEAARALLFHAAVTEDGSERVRTYREALQWLEPSSERFRQVEERLATLLLAESEEMKELSSLRRQWLEEAGARLMGLGLPDKAARAFRRLGDREAEKRALTEAGDIEGLEALLAREQEHSQEAQRWEQLALEVEANLRFGARNDALRALTEAQHWVASPVRGEELRRQRSELVERRPKKNRVILRLGDTKMVCVRKRAVTVGRAGNDLDLRDPSVSRRHVEFEWRDHDVLVKDLGSRFGVVTAGRKMAESEAVDCPFEVQISDVTVIKVALNESNMSLCLIGGLDRGSRLLAFDGSLDLPTLPLTLSFLEGWPRLVPSSGLCLRLNGQRCRTGVDLLIGDRFQVEDQLDASGEVLG